jgi:hypothetical protein
MRRIGRPAMSEVWNTKFGPRRVRFDPPTLKEALVAAQGLTGDCHQQAEIAAALMDVPVEDARAALSVMVPGRNSAQIVTSTGRDGGARVVIVERKPSRHFTAGLGALRQSSAERPSAGLAFRDDRQGGQTLPRRGLLTRKPVLV